MWLCYTRVITCQVAKIIKAYKNRINQKDIINNNSFKNSKNKCDFPKNTLLRKKSKKFLDERLEELQKYFNTILTDP